jgi:hypothetical protein
MSLLSARAVAPSGLVPSLLGETWSKGPKTIAESQEWPAPPGPDVSPDGRGPIETLRKHSSALRSRRQAAWEPNAKWMLRTTSGRNTTKSGAHAGIPVGQAESEIAKGGCPLLPRPYRGRANRPGLVLPSPAPLSGANAPRHQESQPTRNSSA